MPFRVVLVCTGNTCRSAMGEGILRSLVPPDSDVEVASAGTAGLIGMPASDHAATVCREHGIDIGGHVSRGLSAGLADEADLVLAMTRWHGDHIASAFPALAARTFTLSEFAAGVEDDVPDPIGGPVEEYELAFDMIEGYLKKALPAILELAGEGER